MLFKHVKDLALPRKLSLYRYSRLLPNLTLSVEICSAVHRISSLLKVRFVFPRPGVRQKRALFPETQLIALLVVAVKLFYPFDQLRRKPRSWTEPGVLGINWDVWCDLQAEYEARFVSDGRIGRGNIISVNEQDIMKMSGTQLDEYLDWCEQTWVDEESSASKKQEHWKELLDMFPTGRLDESSFAEISFDEESKIDQVSVDQNLTTVQGSLSMRDVVSKGQEEKSNRPVRRIGNFYKRYRKAKDLPPQARKFHEVAASLAGISLSCLLTAVLHVEMKLQFWRRKQLQAEETDSEHEGSEDDMEISGGEHKSQNEGDDFDREDKDHMTDDVRSSLDR